jgi:hypothetical protein
MSEERDPKVESPYCGSTKGVWTDKAELYCDYCNWLIYPPSDTD